MRTTLQPRSLAALLLLAVLAVAAMSCNENTPDPLLTATGGGGASFVSQYTRLQVVGGFNGFSATAPFMSQPEPGMWKDTLTVQTGCYFIKMRTENDWDETPDFGRCTGSEDSCQSPVPEDGAPLDLDVCAVTGQGTAIGQLEFAVTGSYEFVFDEPAVQIHVRRLSDVGNIAGTLSFEGGGFPAATVSVYTAGTTDLVTTVTSSTVDGTFLVEALSPGTYDVTAFANGFMEARVDGVVVTAFDTADVGTIDLMMGCTSQYTQIQLVGDFNGFSDAVESMTEVSPCVWADTLTITTPANGCAFLKFRTGGAWGSDYGGCSPEDPTCPGTGSLTGSVCVGVPGSEPAIGKIQFDIGGTYEFLLDEGAMTYAIRKLGAVETGSVSGAVEFAGSPSPRPIATVSVLTAGTGTVVGTAQSDSTDGTFTVAGVLAGDYDVRFTATGFVDSLVTDVTVTPPADTPLGTVTLRAVPKGAIWGVVNFADSPAPRPAALVVVYNGGTNVVARSTNSSTADGSFVAGDLVAGTYDLEVRATDYVTQRLDGVTVAPPDTVNAGSFTMPRDCAVTVQVVGDFNGWAANAPFMSQTDVCLYADTLFVPAGVTRIKFRTDGDWDATPDWGCCAAPSCAYPVSGLQIGPACPGVGLGDALELDFATEGTYLFQLDQDAGQFFVGYLGPVPGGAAPARPHEPLVNPPGGRWSHPRGR